jgi:hypothetical protein
MGGWWDFSDITTLWQDTGRSSAVSADGQNILGVTDKSGAGHHLSHASGVIKYKTNIKNSKSAALTSFAVDSILSATMTITNGAATILVVAAFSAVAQQRRSLIGGGGNYFGADFSNTSKLTLFETSDHASTHTCDTNFHYFVAVPNGASSKQRVDAVEVYSGNAGSGDFTNPNIGDDGSGSNLIHVAYIAEVMVYNAVVGASDLTYLESYLAAKWAI